MKFVIFFVLICLSLSKISWAQDSEKNTEAAGPPTTPANESNKSSSPSSSSAFEVHAQLGIPFGIGGGVDYISENRAWSAGVFGNSASGTADKVDYKVTQGGITGRWHPFSGSFFLGSSYGTQTVALTSTEAINGVQAKVDFTVKNQFLTPLVGWIWITDFGLTLGFELGAQIQLGATSEIKTNVTQESILTHPDYLTAEQDAKDAGDKFGKSTLPHLTLLRLGYAF